MPKASVVSLDEKDNIAKIAYALKAKDPTITKTKIAKIVKRNINTVTRVMSDKRFSKYRDQMKKRIDEIRFNNIVEADILVGKALKEGKVKPYQAIGASKTYYEQSFGLQEGTNISVNNQVPVQVVRGNVSYSENKEEKPET